MKLKKNERRIAIQQAIEHNPFITDHELCEQFSVSIQTIRLDRTHLKIPELRKRIKLVAEQNYQHLESLEANEIFGDIIKMNPNIEAEFILPQILSFQRIISHEDIFYLRKRIHYVLL